MAATVLVRFEPNLAATWANTHTASTNVTDKPHTHHYYDVTRRLHLLHLQLKKNQVMLVGF